jgi:hypothetical protein
MLAVLSSGAAVSLSPLPLADARQLLALQRVLATHPVAAPISGASQPAFRARGGGTAAGAADGELYRHPPPAGAPAELALPSPLTPAAVAGTPGAEQAQQAGEGGPGEAAAQPASPRAQQQQQQQQAEPSTPAASTAARREQQLQQLLQQQSQTEAPIDAILDADLLQSYLLLPLGQQAQLVASTGLLGATAGGGRAADMAAARLALQLNNLVAQLLL